MVQRKHGSLRSERGATTVLIALTLIALTSVVALAVDIGMLLNARSEAQRTADSAALAGAGSLIVQPGDEPRARLIATQYGARNTVRDDPVVLLPEDIQVDLAFNRVTVTVRRFGSRGTAVSTWFARVFGIDEVDVAARATAEVGTAAGARCLKPWAVPDAWDDPNIDGIYDPGEYYDQAETGFGSDWRNGMQNGIDLLDNGIDPIGTTYVNDRGRPLQLKPGSPHESVVSGWFFPWDIPQVDGSPPFGGDKYRWNIANCNPTIIVLGDEYWVENGNMIGPTIQGVGDLVDQDPGTSWDSAGDSVGGSTFTPWRASPRIVHMPLYNPTTPIDPGKNPLVFNNIMAFYLEGMQGSNVIGRFLEAGGIGDGSGGNPVPGLQFVRLVE